MWKGFSGNGNSLWADQPSDTSTLNFLFGGVVSPDNPKPKFYSRDHPKETTETTNCGDLSSPLALNSKSISSTLTVLPIVTLKEHCPYQAPLMEI